MLPHATEADGEAELAVELPERLLIDEDAVELPDIVGGFTVTTSLGERLMPPTRPTRPPGVKAAIS